MPSRSTTRCPTALAFPPDHRCDDSGRPSASLTLTSRLRPQSIDTCRLIEGRSYRTTVRALVSCALTRGRPTPGQCCPTRTRHRRVWNLARRGGRRPLARRIGAVQPVPVRRCYCGLLGEHAPQPAWSLWTRTQCEGWLETICRTTRDYSCTVAFDPHDTHVMQHKAGNVIQHACCPGTESSLLYVHVPVHNFDRTLFVCASTWGGGPKNTLRLVCACYSLYNYLPA